MRVGVLFSGGKDSSLALHKARQFHDIVCLISLLSENPESFMFHVPNIELTKIQAKAAQLPLLQKATKGEKESELHDLKQALNTAKMRFQIEGVVSGAIRSVYQASRIQEICRRLNLWCFNPLWLRNPMELLGELVEKEFRVIVSGVFAYPLDESMLGRVIDSETIGVLRQLSEKYSINPSGEGGEIETTVLDAPFFKKRVEVLEHRVFYKDHSGIFKIEKARLIAK